MNSDYLDQIKKMDEQELANLLKMTVVDQEELAEITALPLKEKQIRAAALLELMTTDTDDLEDFSFLEESTDYDSLRYSPEDLHRVETFLEAHFGTPQQVYHEILSPDLHIDLMVIPPTQAHPFYVISTLGMGAFPMNVPDEQLDTTYQRTEVFLTLPPTWDLENLEDESNYWPLRLLKTIARFPYLNETFLDFGHTVSNEEPFASNTLFNSCMLMAPFNGLQQPALLSQGDGVFFLQLIPLYPQELTLKLQRGLEALLARFDEKMTHIIDNQRKNYGL